MVKNNGTVQAADSILPSIIWTVSQVDQVVNVPVVNIFIFEVVLWNEALWTVENVIPVHTLTEVYKDTN